MNKRNKTSFPTVQTFERCEPAEEQSPTVKVTSSCNEATQRLKLMESMLYGTPTR